MRPILGIASQGREQRKQQRQVPENIHTYEEQSLRRTPVFLKAETRRDIQHCKE